MDGEMLERFWLYFGLFRKMIKEMLLIYREDVLFDVLFYLVKKFKFRIGRIIIIVLYNKVINIFIKYVFFF